MTHIWTFVSFNLVLQELTFHSDSEEILYELATAEHFKDVKIAYASRTEYPEHAIPSLALMRVRGKVIEILRHGA